jgi:hypothetical protein
LRLAIVRLHLVGEVDDILRHRLRPDRKVHTQPVIDAGPDDIGQQRRSVRSAQPFDGEAELFASRLAHGKLFSGNGEIFQYGWQNLSLPYIMRPNAKPESEDGGLAACDVDSRLPSQA